MILSSRSPITIISISILSIFLVGLWVVTHSIQEEERKNTQLQTNQSKWELNKPDAYSFVLVSGCMWVNSYKIEQTKSGLFSTPIDDSPVTKPITINDLFNEAKKANLTSHRVSVEYHPYFGFPTLIDVDWEKEVIDDECFVQVNEFKVLDRDKT